MSGAQGASYDGNCGGCGITLSGKLLLSYGDTLTFDVSGNKPNYNKSGSVVTVPGGSSATLKLNGTTVWVAAGGPGTCDRAKAEGGVNTIVLCGGVGNANGSGATCTVHWCPSTVETLYNTSNPGAPCYVANGHTHNKTGSCPACTHIVPAVTRRCTNMSREFRHYPTCDNTDHVHCGYGSCGTHKWYPTGPNLQCPGTVTVTPAHPQHDMDCGSPINTWKYSCAIGNGTIQGDKTAEYGTCYVASGYPAESATNNIGGCKATIRLSTQYNMNYHLSQVSNPTWRNVPVNLIVKDNAVCFYKRR